MRPLFPVRMAGTPIACESKKREVENIPQGMNCRLRPGETFFVRLSAFAPATTHQGLRADRDLATQIVGRLVEMEQEYFAHANLDR